MSMWWLAVALAATPQAKCAKGKLKACEAVQADLLRRAAQLAADGVDVPAVLRQPLLAATLQSDLLAGRTTIDDPRCQHLPAGGCSGVPTTEDHMDPRRVTVRKAFSGPRRPAPSPRTFSGRVTWPDGRAAAGVTVTMTPERNHGPQLFVQSFDYGTVFADALILGQAVTDDEGRYTFDDVPPHTTPAFQVSHRDGVGRNSYGPDIALRAPTRVVTVHRVDGSHAVGAVLLGEEGPQSVAEDGKLYLIATNMPIFLPGLVVSADGTLVGELEHGRDVVRLDASSPRCRWRYPNGDEARPEGPCGPLLRTHGEEHRAWITDAEWHDESDGRGVVLGAVVSEPRPTDCLGNEWMEGLGLRSWVVTDEGGHRANPGLCHLRGQPLPERLWVEAVVTTDDGGAFEELEGRLVAGDDGVTSLTDVTRGATAMATRRFVLSDGTPLAGLGVRVSDDQGRTHRQVFTDHDGRVEVPVDRWGRAWADRPHSDNQATSIARFGMGTGLRHTIVPIQRNARINLGGPDDTVLLGPFPALEAPRDTDWMNAIELLEGEQVEPIDDGLARVLGVGGTVALLAWAGPERVLRLDVSGATGGTAHLLSNGRRDVPMTLPSIGSQDPRSFHPWRRDRLGLVLQCEGRAACSKIAGRLWGRLGQPPEDAAYVVLSRDAIHDHARFARDVVRARTLDGTSPWELVRDAAPQREGSPPRVFVTIDGIPVWAGPPDELTPKTWARVAN